MTFEFPRSTVARLVSIASLAVLVQGYHLGVDDAEIYVPAIKRVADPNLYPFGSEFFMSHAHLSLFPELVGMSARLTHLPIDFVIFCWYVASIFLLLLASWRLLSACFPNHAARWSGVALLAGTLSVPVAGTALVIMDPYVTARSLSTPATIFAIACYISNRRKQAGAWLILTALVHPQMGVYGAAFLGCLWWSDRSTSGRFRPHANLDAAPVWIFLSGLPFLYDLQPARGAAREALLSRTYFFVSNWAWYEWMGVFAPLALLWWWSSARLRGTTPVFRSLLRTLAPFGLLFTVAGLALTASPRLENFARLQPMRSFHLIYVIFFSMLGGLMGEYVLRGSTWRWLGIFVPLAASVCLLQHCQFPSSAHVEWPGYGYHNTWNSAFFWIRQHTPKNAVFALDPNYMRMAGEDQHGFRAVAERSALADAVKDSGAVSLFPQLAGHWKSQVQAQKGWETLDRRGFEHLATLYPVTWIVTRSPGPAGLACLYQSEGLSVCRIGVLGPAGPAVPDGSSLAPLIVTK
jgi:hypothetical protein